VNSVRDDDNGGGNGVLKVSDDWSVGCGYEFGVGIGGWGGF